MKRHLFPCVRRNPKHLALVGSLLTLFDARAAPPPFQEFAQFIRQQAPLLARGVDPKRESSRDGAALGADLSAPLRQKLRASAWALERNQWDESWALVGDLLPSESPNNAAVLYLQARTLMGLGRDLEAWLLLGTMAPALSAAESTPTPAPRKSKAKSTPTALPSVSGLSALDALLTPPLLALKVRVAFRLGFPQETLSLMAGGKAPWLQKIPPQESLELKVMAARSLGALGRPRQALELLQDPLKAFPSLRVAREAFDVAEGLRCQYPELLEDDLLRAPADKRDGAREALRRVGGAGGMWEWALAQAGVSPDVNGSDARISPEMNQLQSALEAQEFFNGIRDGQTALRIGESLKSSWKPPQENASIEEKALWDRFVSAWGKSLNMTGQSREAVKWYQQNTPKNTPVSTPPDRRLLLSMNFAGMFAEVFEHSSRASHRQDTSNWEVFWNGFLAGKDVTPWAQKVFAKAKSNPENEDQARLTWWHARWLESLNDPKALALYTGLASNPAAGIWGIFARTKLHQGMVWNPDFRLSKASQWGDPIDPSAWKSLSPELQGIAFLSDVGLGAIATREALDLFRKRHQATHDPNQMARWLPMLAHRSQAYSEASLFVRRRFDTFKKLPTSTADFQHRMQSEKSLWRVAWPLAWAPLVKEASEKLSIDAALVLAITRTESNYDPFAVSPAGAFGPMQIMPYTGHRIAGLISLGGFRPDELATPTVGVPMGAWYLAWLLNLFDGNPVLTAAAYNAGPEAVSRWIAQTGPSVTLDAFVENIPFDETRNYVSRVMGHMAIYWALYGEEGGEWLALPSLTHPTPPKAGYDLF